jgi:hypothetical protein
VCYEKFENTNKEMLKNDYRVICVRSGLPVYDRHCQCCHKKKKKQKAEKEGGEDTSEI